MPGTNPLALLLFTGLRSQELSNTSRMMTMLCYTSTCVFGTLFDGTWYRHRRAIVVSVMNYIGS